MPGVAADSSAAPALTSKVRPACASSTAGAEQARRQGAASAVLARTWPLLILLLALGTASSTIGHFEATDETRWRLRTVGFTDALREGDLAAASATTGPRATMPGVTTMWAGGAARVLWSAVHDDVDTSFVTSEAARDASQAVVGVVSAIAVAVAAWLTARWTGVAVGATVGVVLAVEPVMVANSVVLHPEFFVAVFSFGGVVAAATAFGLTGDAKATAGSPRPMVIIAGAFLGLALLSKLSAVPLAASAGLLWLVALARPPSRGRPAAPLTRRHLVGTGLGIGAVALVTVVTLWPALWVDPIEQLRLLRLSGEIAEDDHATFFRGEATADPPFWFYLYALPLRLTPWMHLLPLVGVAVLVLRRRTGDLRALAVVLVAVLPYLVVVSLSPKKLDRYALAFIPWLAVLGGFAVAAAGSWWTRTLRGPARRAVAVAAVGVAAVAVASAWSVQPWGLAYFNPLLGGGATGERSLLIGRGEGLELTDGILRQVSGDRCGEVTVARRLVESGGAHWTCGAAVRFDQAFEADFAVIYASDRQRMDPSALAVITAPGESIGQVHLRGVLYAEVFDLRPAR